MCGLRGWSFPFPPRGGGRLPGNQTPKVEEKGGPALPPPPPPQSELTQSPCTLSLFERLDLMNSTDSPISRVVADALRCEIDGGLCWSFSRSGDISDTAGSHWLPWVGPHEVFSTGTTKAYFIYMPVCVCVFVCVRAASVRRESCCS